jgi:hypothetical protein
LSTLKTARSDPEGAPDSHRTKLTKGFGELRGAAAISLPTRASSSRPGSCWRPAEDATWTARGSNRQVVAANPPFDAYAIAVHPFLCATLHSFYPAGTAARRLAFSAADDARSLTLHRSPHDTAFDHQRQIADLDYLTTSRAAMTSMAEQYVGLPMEVSFESK